jgi:hypothetical protein
MQENMFSILVLVVLWSLLFGAANTAVFLCKIVLGVLLVLCAAHLMDFIESRGRPGRVPLGGTMRESGGLQSEARARAPRGPPAAVDLAAKVPGTLVQFFKQGVGAWVQCGQVFHAYLKLRAAGDEKPEDEKPEARRSVRARSPQRGPSPQCAQPSAAPAPRARSALQLLEEVVGACVQYGRVLCEDSVCEDSVCTICLGEFDNPVTTKCGHAFCKDCVVEWETTERLAGRKPSCPVCRAPL